MTASNGNLPRTSSSRPKRPASVPPSPRVPALPRGQGTILVTGACGRLGKRLVRVQHRERRVVGVDRRPFPGKPKDVVHEQVDIRRKKLKDVFRSEPIEAVVHLGVMHNPRASQAEHHSWNVAGFQKLLEYVAQFQVPKLVVLSSANVYGPQPDNAQFLNEDAPLLGGARFSEIRDLIEVDMLAQSYFWRTPETETVILRPVHILGSVRNAPSNYLRRPWVPVLLGFDPMVQVIHEDDVVEAILLALEPNVRGIFNLTGPGAIPLSKALDVLGKKTVPIPSTLATRLQRGLWRFRLSAFPAPEYDHIRFVCMVDGTRARDVLGFSPRRGLRETLEAVLDT